MINIFKRKDKTEEKTQSTEQPQSLYKPAPGTEIRYSPELISNLKSHHRKLLQIYSEAQAAYETKDFAKVGEKLREFRNIFNGHILTENIKLYVYMEHSLSQDPVNAAIITDYKREMNGIGMAVHNFLKKYESIGENTELRFTFSAEFSDIGKVLVSRVENEENILYPLYAPYY